MRNWEFLPHFIVRASGFPFELAERLAMPRAAAAARDLLSAEAGLCTLWQELESGLFKSVVDAANLSGFTKPEIKLIYRVRKAAARWQQTDAPGVLATVSHGDALAAWIGRWNTALEKRECLRKRAHDVFDAELERCRAAIKQIAESTRFQEALYISNPDGYLSGVRYLLRHWEPGSRPSRVKSAERMVWKYVQRFCAKNDTVSFFGPANYGIMNADRTGWVSPEVRLGGIAASKAFLSYWAAAELASAITRDPEIMQYLKPRLNPSCELLAGNKVRVHGAGKTVALDSTRVEMLRAADGGRTLLEVGRLAGLGSDELVRAAEALSRPGLMICRIEIPASIHDALEYLLIQTGALPESLERRRHWLDVLGRFDRLRNEFQGADVEVRAAVLEKAERLFTEITGLEPRRGQGQMYADRTLFYEECRGDLAGFEFGADLVSDLLRRLDPILEFLAGAGRAVQSRNKRIAMRAFADRFGADQTASYLDVIRHLAAGFVSPNGTAELPEVQALQRKVVERGGERVVEFSARDLPRFPDADATFVTSPDLMLAAGSLEDLRQGRYRIILGELHPGLLVWGELTYFHPDRERLAADARRLFQAASNGIELVNVSVTRRHKNPPFEYPGRTVELGAGKSARPQEETLPASGLIVRHEQDGLHLLDGASGNEIQLYLGDEWCLFSPPQVAQVPLSAGAHTPRIEIEGVVYQRERWHFEPSPERARSACLDGFELFLEMQDFRARHGLPARVFARSAGERKPVYADFDNFFAMEFLAELLGSGDAVDITEMLPDAEALWLCGPEGRHTCEFRTSVFSGKRNGSSVAMPARRCGHRRCRPEARSTVT